MDAYKEYLTKRDQLDTEIDNLTSAIYTLKNLSMYVQADRLTNTKDRLRRELSNLPQPPRPLPTKRGSIVRTDNGTEYMRIKANRWIHVDAKYGSVYFYSDADFGTTWTEVTE